MTDYDYDVLIIGAGPAGESAALNSIKHHMETAVIDNLPQVGGACTHSGTIPSKALRSVVKTLLQYNSNPLIRDLGRSVEVEFPQLLNYVRGVVRQQVQMRSKFYRRNKIDLYKGQAVLIDAHTVRLDLDDGAEEFFTAKSIIIATGSRPYREPTVDFSHPRIFDSDTILTLRYTPRKILIFGAGVIGCEYASLFAGLGTKVDLVNTRERLLEFLDGEISDALSYHLRNQGVMVRHKEALSHVEATDTGVTLHLVSGKRLQADALLWCNGRAGNTDNLGLEALGISANHRGNLSVNHRYQTSVESVYAVGDVIGWPALASAAYNQGRTVSAVVRGKENCSYVDDVPTGIYTLPEISSVGKTERELTEACIPYEVGRAFFKETARGQISGEDSGMLKILFHTGTLEILGIHCFGGEATEIIHIGQAIMKQQGEGNTIRYFVTTTFNYPTMAEAYRIAALNGLNRLQL